MRLAAQVLYCSLSKELSESGRNTGVIALTPAPYWKYMAVGLIFFEADLHTRSGEEPIHRECEGRPVGFDTTGQRGDSILGPVHWSLHHQINTWIRSE